jgi:chromosome segregation ATPase
MQESIAQLSSTHSTVEDLQLEKDLLDDELRELKSEKTSLKEQIDALRATSMPSHNFEKLREEHDLVASNLRDALDISSSENQVLRSELEAARSNLSEKENQIAELNDRLADVDSQIRLQQQETTDFADREFSEQHNEELSVLRQTAEKLQSENDNLRAQTEKLELLSSEKENFLADLTEKIDALSKEKERLEVQLQQMMIHGEHNATADLSELESLRQQIEDLSAKYQEAETQRMKSSMHLAALGKSLKKAENDAETTRNENQALRNTIHHVQIERDEAISDRDIAFDRLRATELEFTSKMDEFRTNLEGVHRDDKEFLSSKQNCNLLEQEVQRYIELEKVSSNQLEESERLAREQNQSHERHVAELNRECNDLRLELATHQESIDVLRRELAAHASIEASSLMTECMELRASVARLQQTERDALEDASTYENECLELREEIIELQQKIVNLEKKSQEQTAFFGSQIEALQRYFDADQGHVNSVEAVNSCNDYNALSFHELTAKLKAKYDRLKDDADIGKQLSEELRRKQAELQDALQERDAIRAENEEILIQFGFLKQQIDEADVYTQRLEEGISGRRQSNRSEIEGSIEALSTSQSDLVKQISAITQERDVLAKRVAMLENLSSSINSADKFGNVAIETDAEEPEKMSKVDDVLDVLVSAATEENVHELEVKIQRFSPELESVRRQFQIAEASLAAEKRTDSFGFNEDKNTMDFQLHLNSSEFAPNSDKYAKELELELKEKQKIIDDLQTHIQSESEENVVKSEFSKDDEPARIVTIEEGLAAASQDELEDILRSYVVSLALALERSEINRAEALNRLVSERETHALSLRRMSENMKRFYASMSYGDA